MPRISLLISAVAAFGLVAVSCGDRERPPIRNTTGGPSSDNSGAACSLNTECQSGICDNGRCAEPVVCVTPYECPTDLYCQYPTLDGGWVAGTAGTCGLGCASPNDCGAGQECQNGQCYTQSACDPALQSTDCAPGEVCNLQTLLCGPPPGECAWPDDCPVGWICNSDNRCLDPNQTDFGSCENDASCLAVAGCDNGQCECSDGACRPKGGCRGAAECGAGNYCQNGTCVASPDCSTDSDCFPYGLVCEQNACTNPPNCEPPSNTCPAGSVCRTNFNPPQCFPEGSNECARDEQCPQGMFCQLFTGTCEEGCARDADCIDQCPGFDRCLCNALNACTPDNRVDLYESCTETEQCPGGAVCSPTDPSPLCTLTDTIGGAIGIDLALCDSECRLVCDTAVNLIVDTCPNGQACGGDSSTGQKLGDVAIKLAGAALGGGDVSATASVCYDTP